MPVDHQAPQDPHETPRDPLEALIHRCQQGDQASWELVVRQCWRRVFNIAYTFVGGDDEAEDLTQDIFLKVFRSLETFDRRANFQTWLTSVSRNLCIDHYRSVRKERDVIDRQVDASALTPAAVGAGRVAALEQQDRVALLRSALARLPDTLRSAVVMRDIQEMSYREIGERLRLPEGTVKSRINRGRIELARQVRQIGGDGRGRVHQSARPRTGVRKWNSARSRVSGASMRTITTTTGRSITLDGDLLAVIDTLYREVTASRALERSYHDIVREIQHLIEQMDADEQKTYLAESLFLNTVKYENDRLEAYLKKLSSK